MRSLDQPPSFSQSVEASWYFGGEVYGLLGREKLLFANRLCKQELK